MDVCSHTEYLANPFPATWRTPANVCNHVTGDVNVCDHVTGDVNVCDHVTGDANVCDHVTGDVMHFFDSVYKNTNNTSAINTRSTRIKLLFFFFWTHTPFNFNTRIGRRGSPHDVEKVTALRPRVPFFFLR